MGDPKVLPPPAIKVVIKDANVPSEVVEISRLRELTSKAMGFPRLRRMGDGSPIPYRTVIDGYEKEVLVLDGYGDSMLDGYGDPITRTERFEVTRYIYLINPYMNHYDTTHYDGYGDRIATRTLPTGLSVETNPYLTESEKIELNAFVAQEEELPIDWYEAPPGPITVSTSALFSTALAAGGAYFDSDYGVVTSGSDVIAWTSYEGDITAHRPAYYGKTGNAPTLDTTLFDFRKCVRFAAASFQSLILDGLMSVFNGAADSKQWTVIVQLFRVDSTNGLLFCAGGTNPISHFISRYTSTTTSLQQRDESDVYVAAAGYNIPIGSESISVVQHNGRDISFWENNIIHGSSPVTVDSIGNINVERVNLVGRWRATDTWDLYLNTGIRRMLILPGIVNPAKLTILQKLWSNE